MIEPSVSSCENFVNNYYTGIMDNGNSRLNTPINPSYHNGYNGIEPCSILMDNGGYPPAKTGDDGPFKVFDKLTHRIANSEKLMLAINTWNVYPRVIYHECKRLGFERVEAAAKDVAANPNIGHRGKYLWVVLKRMGRDVA